MLLIDNDSVLGAGVSEMRCQECGEICLLEPPREEGTVVDLSCHVCKAQTAHTALPDLPWKKEAREFNRAFMPQAKDLPPERRTLFLQEAVRRLFGLQTSKHYKKFVEEILADVRNPWRDEK